MIKLNLQYTKLKLVPYEGSKNKTPVLDLSGIKNIQDYSPDEVRHYLEQDLKFRLWLQKEGNKLKADSVMAFYKSKNPDYDLVMFVCEPNSLLTSQFSDMCGNGIRSLTLHYYLNSKSKQKILKNGLRIWAGSLRKSWIEEVNEGLESAHVKVDLGAFKSDTKDLSMYIRSKQFLSQKNLSKIKCPDPGFEEIFKGLNFGIGLNGDQGGEPHLALILNSAQLTSLSKKLNKKISLKDEENIIKSLRELASLIGFNFTFNELFPRGINFNLALNKGGKIYMSTHERNLASGPEICISQIKISGICQCNTFACGTGGAVVSNIAKNQGLLDSNNITTIHPGGTIEYNLKDSTYMTGDANKTYLNKEVFINSNPIYN